MADDRIILLKDSDIISESMHKINYNFKLLENDSKVNDYRWQQYVSSVENKIDGLKSAADERDNTISRNIDGLQDLIDSMATKEDLQNQINNAIKNADDELRDFVSHVVGQQISETYGDYATTSQLREELGKLKYVSSAAFDVYKAQAAESMASASRIVANSKFAEEDGYLVLKNGEKSTYDSVDDYWRSMSPSDKAKIDPQGKGLDDPAVMEAFLNHCETKFKTVYSELTAIRQIVGAGEANVEIMAAIEKNGQNIAAAIFAEANKDGSSIKLRADRVQLSAETLGLTADDILINSEHRLGLVAGTFIISGDNLSVDAKGNVKVTGDITANNFTTSTGKTFMGSDGILHADGAEINGNITANKFIANWSNDVNENGVTGTLAKQTVIDGQSFNIGVRGMLNIGSNQSFDTSKNALYIKIVNTLPNTGENYNSAFGPMLYGVPMLCMKYDGVEYMLSPATWFRPSGTSSDTSNMRFVFRYYAYPFTVNLKTNQCISIAQGGVKKYLFRPEKSDISATNPFVKIGKADTVYQFEVLDWGGSTGQYDSTKANMLGLSPSLLSKTTNPVEGVYTLASALGTTGQKYTGSGGVQTTITQPNKNDMDNYTLSQDYSLGVLIRESYILNDYGLSLTDVVEKYGIRNAASLMLNLIKDGGSIYGYQIWESTFSGFGKFDCTLSQGYGTPDLDQNLPFSGSGQVNSSYNADISFYPICEITNNGKTHSDGTSKVFVRYSLELNGYYDLMGSSGAPRVKANPADPDNHTAIDFRVSSFNLKLEFDSILELNSSYSSYKPNLGIEGSIKTYVSDLLKNYSFDNINNNHHNDFYKYIKLTGEIRGYNTTNESVVIVNLLDNYNS